MSIEIKVSITTLCHTVGSVILYCRFYLDVKKFGRCVYLTEWIEMTYFIYLVLEYPILLKSLTISYLLTSQKDHFYSWLEVFSNPNIQSVFISF